MPFSSKKQQRYMHWMDEQGKLPKSVNLNEWDKATNFKKLPESAPKFKKLHAMMNKKNK